VHCWGAVRDCEQIQATVTIMYVIYDSIIIIIIVICLVIVYQVLQ
jgi:hypothetical protein